MLRRGSAGSNTAAGQRSITETTLVQFNLSVRALLRRTRCRWGRGPERGVAVDGQARGVLDGAEAGG